MKNIGDNDSWVKRISSNICPIFLINMQHETSNVTYIKDTNETRPEDNVQFQLTRSTTAVITCTTSIRIDIGDINCCNCSFVFTFIYSFYS